MLNTQCAIVNHPPTKIYGTPDIFRTWGKERNTIIYKIVNFDSPLLKLSHIKFCMGIPIIIIYM